MRSRSILALLTSLVVLAFVITPALAAKDDLDTKIASILEETFPADGPGAAVIVVKGGEVVFEGARGMADIEHGVPLTAESVFRLGSITKQFTAAAILLLAERGELSLDDPITEYLPTIQCMVTPSPSSTC